MSKLRWFVLGATLASAWVGASSIAAEICDANYPDACIPPISEFGDLDCDDLGFGGFTVLPPDPHFLDADGNGFGCDPW
jgi:hypothetical protein